MPIQQSSNAILFDEWGNMNGVFETVEAAETMATNYATSSPGYRYLVVAATAFKLVPEEETP